MKDEAKPPEESFVDVFKEVSGKYDNSREPLNVVEQHTNINIGITVRRCTVREDNYSQYF